MADEPAYRIIRKKDIRTQPKMGVDAFSVAVTYSTQDLPPHTLFIPKPDWSEKKEHALIRESIKQRQAERI